MILTDNKVVKYIDRLESKIAFYPTILSLMGILFALIMYYLENQNISKYLLENAPWLVIKNPETARALLSTFIGGLISIMVFSFTMVMILLNRASTNYSPRILPSLIANRRHQIILGIYNSCLLYCIFTLLDIRTGDSKYQLPGFSVLLAIFFMTLCLAAFIYFIHSISQEIQINTILNTIFNKAKHRLNDLIEAETDTSETFPDTSNWDVIKSKKSGYIEDVDLKSISKILMKNDSKSEIIIFKGEYVFKNSPIIKISKPPETIDKAKMRSAFKFSQSKMVENNYVLAFKQISEIIVKAMSPGINDPGTAINAIDYLTELFLLRMQKNEKSIYHDDSKKPLIYMISVNFEVLLYNVMAALRTYCKQDIIIVRKLISMFGVLLQSDHSNAYKKTLIKELENLHDDAAYAIKNKIDLEIMELNINQIKEF